MEKIGKYQILEKLGQGGMGVVYKALDPLIERVVAIKTISTQLDAEPEFRARFFREGRSAGKLSHKNIITIYDLGEENNVAYMAMEFLEGDDLKSMIARRMSISLGRKVAIMVEICEGLAHAHSLQVIHRDIKPANIFITRSGQVKILDFGLARAVSSDLTKSGLTMGTPNYMSPEQVRGDAVDHRTDIFSAGVVFYEMFSYRKPFEGESFASTIYKILQHQPDPLEQLDAGIPVELSAIVTRALAKSVDERYPSAMAMLENLHDFARVHEAVLDRSSTLFAHSSIFEGHSGETSDRRPRSEADAAIHEMETGVLPVVPKPETASSGTSGSQSTTAASRDSREHTSDVAEAPRSPRLRSYAVAASVALIGFSVGLWLMVRGPGEPAGLQDEGRISTAETRSVPGPEPGVPEPPATPPAPPAVDPRVRAGLGRATTALGNDRYDEAIREAEAVLKLDSGNTEATQLLNRARENRDIVARNTARARELYSAGKYQEASVAVAEVLKVSPSNSEARQLASQLNQYARRSADDAMAQARQAKSQADSVNAVDLAPRSYSLAQTTESEAARLYGQRRYGEASAKFFEAGGLYRSAETEARSERDARAERTRRAEQERQRILLQSQTEAARQAYERDRARAVDAGADTRAAERFREGTRLAADAQGKTDRGDLAGAKQDLENASSAMVNARDAALDAVRRELIRPVVPEPPRRVEPEERPRPAEDTRALIAAVVTRYKAALENQDLAGLKAIWPGLSGNQERAIQADFQNSRTIQVDFENLEYQISNDTARVTGRRSYRVQTEDGQRLQTVTKTTIQLRRNGGAWTIESIRFEAVQ